MKNYLLLTSFDDVSTEMWQLFKWRVFAPHCLGNHLGQFHSSKSWAQPSITTQHIHTGLDQSDGLSINKSRIKKLTLWEDKETSEKGIFFVTQSFSKRKMYDRQLL